MYLWKVHRQTVGRVKFESAGHEATGFGVLAIQRNKPAAAAAAAAVAAAAVAGAAGAAAAGNSCPTRSHRAIISCYAVTLAQRSSRNCGLPHQPPETTSHHGLRAPQRFSPPVKKQLRASSSPKANTHFIVRRGAV